MQGCPRDALNAPHVVEWLDLHARMRMFAGALPRAGGLDDQDALTMRALSVLRIEDSAIDAAIAKATHG